MIELTSVIVLLAILAVFGYTAFSSAPTYELKSRVDVVKAHLRYAQTRAMNSNLVWGIDFSANTTYSLFRNGNASNRVIILGEDSNVVSLPSGFSVSTGIVSFDDWGKPYTDAAGTSAQSGQRDLSLSRSGFTETITIMPNTGFIP